MTTKEDWTFRAYTLREAANVLRNNAATLIESARRYEELAENSLHMADACPQPPANRGSEA